MPAVLRLAALLFLASPPVVAATPPPAVCLAELSVERAVHTPPAPWPLLDPGGAPGGITLPARAELRVTPCPGTLLRGIVVETCQASRLSLFAAVASYARVTPTVTAVENPATRYELRFAEAHGEGFSIQSADTGTPMPVCVGRVQLLDAQGQVAAVVRPVEEKATITASSALEPGEQYGPERAWDDTAFNGWASHWVNGKDAFVEVSFTQPRSLTALRLRNGYHRSAEHLAANASIRSYEVLLDGKPAAAGELPPPALGRVDEIRLPEGTTFTTLRLNVKEAHPGQRDQDLVLSEVYFQDHARWVRLDIGAYWTRVKDRLTSQLAAAGLDALLQRPWRTPAPRSDGPGTRTEATLELKPNGRAWARAATTETPVGGCDMGSCETLPPVGWQLEGGFQVVNTKGKCTTLQLLGLMTRFPPSETERPGPASLTLRVCSKGRTVETQLQGDKATWVPGRDDNGPVDSQPWVKLE